MRPDVTVIHGHCFGVDNYMYFHIIAVAPKGMTPSEILQKALEQKVIINIPTRYEVQTLSSGARHSEGLFENSLLLIIP